MLDTDVGMNELKKTLLNELVLMLHCLMMNDE
jgi:hypothetical protein